jgi:hypothetical protein
LEIDEEESELRGFEDIELIDEEVAVFGRGEK